jgi:hypothetical protein
VLVDFADLQPRRITRHSAIVGTIIWIGWQMLTDVFEPAALFVLSPLVLVPLLLTVIFDDEEDNRPLIRALCFAQLPCAMLLPVSLSMKPGAFALLASLPWTGWTALAALEGGRRMLAMLRRSGLRGLYDSELAIAAGLAFPIIGSGWLLCDRLALQPLGFSPLIVLLTAAHFHHAGLTLPISAGLLGRSFGAESTTGAGIEPWRMTAVTVVIAVPLVALGITFSPWLELLAAWITAASGIVVAIGLLRRANGLPLIPAMLSALAGAALLAGMSFAASYAIGEYVGTPWPDITSMIRLHGAINALGFGLLGAWAWHLTPPPMPKLGPKLGEKPPNP